MFSSLRAALVVSAAIAANLTVTDDAHQTEAVLQSSIASVDGTAMSSKSEGSVVNLSRVGRGGVGEEGRSLFTA